MYVRSLTVSLIFSNKIDTKLKHILLFQKKSNMPPGMGCVPRRENPLYQHTYTHKDRDIAFTSLLTQHHKHCKNKLVTYIKIDLIFVFGNWNLR